MGENTIAAIFRRPFNKDSAHHTPFGDGVKYGIPPSTLKAKTASPTYDAGQEGVRGRLGMVKTFRTGSTLQGAKYLHLVKPGDRSCTVRWHNAGGLGTGLPTTCVAPEGVSYPKTDGDNEVLLYPRDGDELQDRAAVFAQWQWVTGDLATARSCWSYPLRDRDVRNRFDDPGDWGPGAIDWRHPAGFLRGAECDRSGKLVIRHLLNATATRHSRQGASAALHVLSKGMSYPAWEIDRPMPAGDNLGDLPYGTIIAVRWQDRAARDDLGLTPLGRRLFDTFLYHGCCLCDGQGQVVNGGAVLQLRVDYDLASDSALNDEVNQSLSKILPYLWPVFSARKHNEDAPRHTDGLIYVGGGGPISKNAINNAWDVGAELPEPPPIEPPVPPVEPPITPPDPPVEAEGHIVTCPSCGARFLQTFSEIETPAPE